MHITCLESHLGCSQPFDGQGGEFAHTNKSLGVGYIHVDDDELFSSHTSPPVAGRLPLLLVLVHEIGHVLGLSHVDHVNAIMYPTLRTVTDRCVLPDRCLI